MLWAKAFAGDLVGDGGGSALGRRSSRWGHHVGALSLLHEVLWVKTLSGLWTSDGSAIGVMPSLEASFLEIQLGLWQY